MIQTPRGRQIEQLDLGSLSLLRSTTTRKLISMHPRGHFNPRSSHLFANSATDVEFRGCKRSAQQRSFPSPSLFDAAHAFKREKRWSRRIRRQCQRESWIRYVSSITSSTTSQQLWRKVKAANGLYRDFKHSDIGNFYCFVLAHCLDVANLFWQTFASVSSSDSYSPEFQATKNRLERTPINFRCRQTLQYITVTLTCFTPAWTIYRSVVKVRTCRMIERQLQTAVNNIVKWCDTNGHSISAARVAVHFATNSTVQQGFRYRVLLATQSRRNHRQRASGQRGKVGDDASAASAVPLSDMKRVIMHHIFKIWQRNHGVSGWITNCTPVNLS
ncbi:putative RNA-directed DNA polymerase from transposon X-element [Trichonephila clavipes]|nr:putative RNA-directed DNA polymerase from transposon X-element [Trichonephila clavipes]